MKLHYDRRAKDPIQGMEPPQIIVTFSRKTMDHQRAARQRQIARALAILEDMDPEEIGKGPDDVRRYLRPAGRKDRPGYVLDVDRIAEEEQYDGYLAIATNVTDKSVEEILEISRQRFEIEDDLRAMEDDPDLRPVSHPSPARIRAHLPLRFTALLVVRTLEARMDDAGTHVATADLIETLKNMEVTSVAHRYFQALYSGSKALDALIAQSDLALDHRNYRPSDLWQGIKKILQ